ncbi:diaminopimelate decarboxylase [Candidatus Parcubacteria bacterium]|nr:diaminopimelate decarboxylase [Patescibacteria group bacterium]MBU4309001.1 diaminopimelate decarboxylase [Patescibacteria group bacterium]MBU4432405.1 diaminopimelate decarboxylase [Patescibacteria group bacterium]MBU4577361.1 diaminopimelate decarboxylase [Patescibacteria group bacterium]MCG2697049.1 diaminopimelate decarboxylase [Candidatus Parcubacteria bacterium]
MSQIFKDRLFPLIPKIAYDFRPIMAGNKNYPVPSWALSPGFHVYDEQGIRDTITLMQKLFFTAHLGTNFFAVKACPNVQILKIMLDAGFGLDCASPTELYRAQLAGALPHQVMYTSNNTHPSHYEYAMSVAGILNLDDISFIDKLPRVPERICFRYNPGERRTEGSNSIIGNPVNQKYGLQYDQIIDAYKKVQDKGATIFGIHTMYASNCRDAKILAGNAKMQLEMAERIQDMLGIQLEFINIGGGLGVNYNPEDQPLDIVEMSELINHYLDDFKTRRGYLPELYMESGRFVTGPNGVLVSQVINKMDKYKQFIGVDICDAADILRAGIYPSPHEVSILCSDGEEKILGPKRTVSIVGPLCENIHMISDRNLPIICEDDFVVVHDTGAHGIAMAMRYNGWGESQQLLLRPDNSVVRISNAATIAGLLATETLLNEKTVQY